jgi:S-adenosylmethionine:tRNA ribosyltransferase-isomerase
MNPHDINIEDFNYTLAEEKIAQFPLKSRDKSKMLISWENEIEEGTIKDFPDWISKLKKPNVILNDTRVVRARLFFSRGDGLQPFEIFYLDPVNGSIEETMSSKYSIVAWCKVRHSKKWKNHTTLKNNYLSAKKIEQIDDKFKIQFFWSKNVTWSEILEEYGKTPLPPYMKREVNEVDSERYQTVFSKKEGSVAAPTAGLHFTPEILSKISGEGGIISFLQLHIGAGTFQPVSDNLLGNHKMHSEEVSISIETIKSLMNKFDTIAIGTTATRALESLYWITLELFNNDIELNHVDQWLPYKKHKNYLNRMDSLEYIHNYLISKQKKSIQFSTSLLIVPGYEFRFVDLLLTNFHQPKSTLLLLIAAAVGDKWKAIYDYALQMNFRFLSYGDACLLKVK